MRRAFRPFKTALVLRLLSLLALALFDVPQGASGGMAATAGSTARHQANDTKAILGASAQGGRVLLPAEAGRADPVGGAGPKANANPANVNPAQDAGTDVEPGAIPGAPATLVRPQGAAPSGAAHRHLPYLTFVVLPPARGPPVA
ncbi:hypothetical protein [Roseicitreum antarcticum]|uniref:Uncharacterized protein n=1 Tax=Roseicitreum antarcticum TaxID=564137 RepID=A0A1H2YRH3_9RHOB|nr:hypothetical protein [Roseicitreum antarcticum]SDX07680.1 hypothetical protein SAMN04488238_105104 [Roseicitreum antarcticum]